MASMEGSAGTNHSTQLFAAGCCFILVICATQVWRSNVDVGSLTCVDGDLLLTPADDGHAHSESTVVVRFEDGQLSSEGLSNSDVRTPAELLVTKLSVDVGTVAGELHRGQRDVPTAREFDRVGTETHRSPVASRRSQLVDLGHEKVPALAPRTQVASTIAPVAQIAKVEFNPADEIGREMQPRPLVASQIQRSRPSIQELADLVPRRPNARPGPDRDPEQSRGRRPHPIIEDLEPTLHEAIVTGPRSHTTLRPEFDRAIEPLPQPPARKRSVGPEPKWAAPAKTQASSETKSSLGTPASGTALGSRSTVPAGHSWPRPNALINELDRLPPVYGVEQWVREVLSELAAITQLSSIDDPAVLDHIQNLDALVEKSRPISSQLARQDQVAFRQAAYSLSRRLDVWRTTHRSSHPRHVSLPYQVFRSVQPDVMANHVDAIRERANAMATGAKDWQQYLLLDELHNSAHGRGDFIGPARIELAQIVLDRLADPDLTSQQESVLQSLGVEALEHELRLWATRPISPHGFLKALERFEQYPNPVTSRQLAIYRKDLQWSAVPSQNDIAVSIDQHYRNANIRISVDEAMLNRLVPAVRDMQQPVRDHILGARVQGHNRSQTRILVRLLPDRSRLRFMFEARGVMAARTTATKGPVTLLNRSNSQFNVRKVVVMDQKGPRFGRSQASASGNSNLLGMRTDFDNVPIIGSVVRRMAKKQADEQAGVARRILVNRVEQQARQQVDQQIEAELAMARQRLEEKLLVPLRGLDLNPRAMDMQTFQGRMILRGRLAAEHQLAGYTARPQAHLGSLLTMQIHESALNNFFQQLNLDGREMNLRDLYDEVSTKLQLEAPSEPVDIPDNVTIRFDHQAAVRVVIDKGVVQLKLRIRHLQPDGERGWKNFEVTAKYRPYRDERGGVEFYFSREPGIAISKRNLALRAIFTKVLSQNRKIYLVNPELASDRRFANLNVTQMEINDGWIGLSVGEGNMAPSIAIRPAHVGHSR